MVSMAKMVIRTSKYVSFRMIRQVPQRCGVGCGSSALGNKALEEGGDWLGLNSCSPAVPTKANGWFVLGMLKEHLEN